MYVTYHCKVFQTLIPEAVYARPDAGTTQLNSSHSYEAVVEMCNTDLQL